MKNQTKATTLSVIMNDSKSVFCGVTLSNGEYFNLTARWDQGPAVALCGFPEYVKLHNEDVSQDPDCGITYADFIDLGSKLGTGEVYLSKQDESVILKKILSSIKKQFITKRWSDSTSSATKRAILKAFNVALKVGGV
jgi:hypothetical protein